MGIVAVTACDSYRNEAVEAAMDECLRAIGGLKRFIRPGMIVAIKPNLLMAKKPEQAATTHPSVMRALIRAVQEAGGIAAIVESPGGLYTVGALRHVYAATGMEQVADETGARLNFDLRVEKRECPEATLVKSLHVLKPLADADLIIDVAKLKTHMMMVYTGAVKNMFGAVAGTEKADYHARMSSYDRFAEALTDIYMSVRPTLCVIDAIDAMEGEGPGSGTPRHLGALIVAEDGFEADLAATEMVGLKAEQVPVLRHALKAGLVSRDSATFPLHVPQDFLCADFAHPSLKIHENGGVRKGLMYHVGRMTRPKPVIRQQDCVRCGRCAQACPVKVIRKESDGRYLITHDACIRCFCCHELCPEKAVDIRRNLLSRLLVQGSHAGIRQDGER